MKSLAGICDETLLMGEPAWRIAQIALGIQCSTKGVAIQYIQSLRSRHDPFPLVADKQRLKAPVRLNALLCAASRCRREVNCGLAGIFWARCGLPTTPHALICVPACVLWHSWLCVVSDLPLGRRVCSHLFEYCSSLANVNGYGLVAARARIPCSAIWRLRWL